MDQNKQKPPITPLSLEDTPIYKKRVMLSSIEAEKKLESAYRLLGEMNQTKVKTSKLSEFWPEDAPAAPFIETMTFSELKSVKVSDLLNKHSFTDAKLLGIVGAIEKFIDKSKPKGILSKLINFFKKG